MKPMLIFLFGCILTSIISCTDYDSSYVDRQPLVRGYDGTILDYLKEGDAEYGLKFDSLLFILESLPRLYDTLQNESSELTLFAVPDGCFRSAIGTLNNFRSENEMGPVYLDSLLGDPFIVRDSVFIEVEYDADGKVVREADTILYAREFNYRATIDTMISHYIFNPAYDSEYFGASTGGITLESLYRYGMNVQYDRQPASGSEGAGIRRLILSDTRNSPSESDWVNTYTRSIDLIAGNGVIHLLLPEHEFGFESFAYTFLNVGEEAVGEDDVVEEE